MCYELTNHTLYDINVLSLVGRGKEISPPSVETVQDDE